ncbi:MAG: GIY-YIG nuclease family protein [Pseudomonadota bacterium]
MDVWRAGDFPLWQSDQRQRSFNRENVVAVIQTKRPNVWMFAGAWRVVGAPVRQREAYARKVGRRAQILWFYTLQAVPKVDPLVGRLFRHYEKTARSNYRRMETVIDAISVQSYTEHPNMLPAFEGYAAVRLAMPVLTAIVQRRAPDWQTALSAVGGVYLLTDADGHQYVGSATGVDGFWGRWETYAKTGHGGNARLRNLNHAAFHFAILETADTRADPKAILAREGHWKEVLGSRTCGLNAN